MEKDNKVTFSGDSCTVKDARDRVVARANLQGGVYWLEAADDQACAEREGDQADLWHRRLGHLNGRMDLLRKRLAEELEGCIISKERCKMYVFGKDSKLPFRSQGKMLADYYTSTLRHI